MDSSKKAFVKVLSIEFVISELSAIIASDGVHLGRTLPAPAQQQVNHVSTAGQTHWSPAPDWRGRDEIQ